MTTPIVTKKRRADRLARRPDGAYDWQAIQNGVFVKIEKLADKKRRKAAEKEKSKLRAEQNQRNSDIAENSAIVARERLHMGKSSNSLVDIAKSIISRGPDAQPGVTSRVLFEAMQKAADSLYAGQPLSAEQRFARFCDTPEGTILRKAQGKAAPEPLDDDQADEDECDSTNSAYRKLLAKAEDLRLRSPGLTEAAAFSKVYADPSNRPLVKASRSEHFAKLARAGLR
jgi:hypothetical protein